MKKPFQTYNGGKSGNGTFQTIINNIPKCDVLIEAFAGNCSIARNINRPAVTVLNDYDRSVYDELLKLQEPGIIVENNCYRRIVEKYKNTEGVFFYLDPPYLKSSRKNQQDLYRCEFSDSDHEKFLTLVLTVESNCMISHYPCDIYDEALKDWRKVDFKSMTRAGLATERLYMNYSEPEFLQDYRYVGQNFIKRQQLKRKKENLLRKLEEMPDTERLAILRAVIEKYNYASAIFNTPQ